MQFGRAVLCAIWLAGHADATRRAAPAKVATKAPAAVAAKKAEPAAAAKPTPPTPPKAEAAKAKAPATKPAAAAAAKPKLSKEKAVQNALPQLQSIMAQAQSSLARAERHHEKAVKKARGAVSELFQEQAKFMGVQVAKYASALDQAAKELSMVINASKAELAAEEQAEAKNTSIGWGGTAMEERARAGAKADAALRELRHIMRKKDRDVEEATRHAMEPLDDATQKLSRRVGDLSPLSDDAKASLEWAMKKGGVGGDIMAKLNITKDAKGVEKAIEAARNMTAQKIKAADSDLAKALANATNVTNTGVKKIETGLIEAEKEEIKRVRR